MPVKSCQHNITTNIITVICSDGFVIELDYGAYLAANGAGKKAIRENALALITAHGGFLLADVQVTESDGQLTFTFKTPT